MASGGAEIGRVPESIHQVQKFYDKRGVRGAKVRAWLKFKMTSVSTGDAGRKPCVLVPNAMLGGFVILAT